jgi:hypothetical protein
MALVAGIDFDSENVWLALIAAVAAIPDLLAVVRAMEAEIARVCSCDGEDTGGGPGVGAIDTERSSFDWGANAYDGTGNVITEYLDCPCSPLRGALAAFEAGA